MRRRFFLTARFLRAPHGERSPLNADHLLVESRQQLWKSFSAFGHTLRFSALTFRFSAFIFGFRFPTLTFRFRFGFHFLCLCPCF